MKKNKALLTSLLLLPLLAGCTTTIIKPKLSYPGDPLKESENPNVDGDIDRTEFNMTVNFFLDYSHSDLHKETETEGQHELDKQYEPIYTMRWYMLVPLGECPAEAILTDAKAADPLYPKFLGYSEYPTSLDDSLLWNFETDYKQSNILSLYGIWTSGKEA